MPDDKEDLNKFADELFRSHDKAGTPQGASRESPSAHQKRVAHIVDKEKYAMAQNQLIEEYRLIARGSYEAGEYLDQEDLLEAIRGGKVFVFKVGLEFWIGAMATLGFDIIMLVLFLSGIAPASEFVLPFYLIVLPFLVTGIVLLGYVLRLILVVGPKGIVWQGGGIPWEDVESLNASEKTVRTRYGPRQKYSLRLGLWDGTSHRIRLQYRTNEAPDDNLDHFIFQVVKSMFDVHGPKSSS